MFNYCNIVRLPQVDQDGDGAINFSEMLTIMIRMHKQTRESQNLLKVFEVMDKDGQYKSFMREYVSGNFLKLLKISVNVLMFDNEYQE